MVYIKDGTSASRRADLELKDLECIRLEIKPKKSKPFLLGNIYRPPNLKIEWNAMFEDCIENVLKEEKEIYLMGDINRNLLSNNVKKSWSYYMEHFGLTQLISEITSVPRSTSYGVYISQLIRFARASSYVADSNTLNKLLTQKLLKAIGIINFAKHF